MKSLLVRQVADVTAFGIYMGVWFPAASSFRRVHAQENLGPAGRLHLPAWTLLL
nr:hypothetical protein [Escherichia coli]